MNKVILNLGLAPNLMTYKRKKRFDTLRLGGKGHVKMGLETAHKPKNATGHRKMEKDRTDAPTGLLEGVWAC